MVPKWRGEVKHGQSNFDAPCRGAYKAKQISITRSKKPASLVPSGSQVRCSTGSPISVHILQMNGESYRLNQSKSRSRRARTIAVDNDKDQHNDWD